MEFLLSLLAAFAFLFILYRLVRTSSKITHPSQAQGKPIPFATGAWPIIGHLPLLAGRELPHKVLASMAEKYGPIFGIRLGVHQAVILSDAVMAKECFSTNDRVFATRPKSLAIELMAYNYAAFGVAPFGEYWRRVRKFVVLELLSNQQLQTIAPARASEVNSSIKDIYDEWTKSTDGSDGKRMVKMEMKGWFRSLIINLLVRVMSGKKYSPGDKDRDKFRRAARKFAECFGTFMVSDVLPSLRWFDLGGHGKVMKKIAKEIDDIMEEWLDEHRREKMVERGEQDFMSVMLSRFEGTTVQEISGYDTDTIIKSTCMAIHVAASDNTTATLTWALSLLINNPSTLAKAQQELDQIVGRGRLVEESDVKNLVYLQAVIKETLRLCPTIVTLLREAMEDSVVGGYHIPKGTRVLINIWKISHDPKYWSEPNEFRPERFLTTHKDVEMRGQHYEFVPFGGGRRICPGISFALQAMHLTLANLIHGFEISNPSNEPIDMTEHFGLTTVKRTPLEVLLKPRLSPNLYE